MARLYCKEFGDWAEYDAKAVYRKENGQWVASDLSSLSGSKFRYEWLPTVEGPVSYVSFGDSIAAGHAIDSNWETNYGTGSQYGVNGNTETVIVPGCYTDIIRNELVSIYGASNVFVKSFARSGDKVSDLMDKLTHAAVISALEKADLVTVCIGANDVLGYVPGGMDDYIQNGDTSTIDAAVETSMATLDNDAAATSYKSLFDRLAAINPNAKYVFTTIYNPYKYLHIDEGQDGFFGPLLGFIPEMNIDVDEIIEDLFNFDSLGYYDVLTGEWVSIELELDLDGLIKEGILLTSPFQLAFDRVNNLGDKAEGYITRLNTILRNKINAYQSTNTNFFVAESKAAFDLFPDKTDSSDDVDYSDLVNVEYTAGYDTAKMDWGRLWEGSDAGTFWGDLAWKYLSFSNGFPSLNVWDYVSFDMAGFAADLIAQIAEKVVAPDTDPHPEADGQAVLKRCFTNPVGLVKYEPNGGGHVLGDAVLTGRALTNAPLWVGHTFDGWYTDAALTQALPSGYNFADYTSSFTLADLVSGSSVITKLPKTTTLYAKWSANK